MESDRNSLEVSVDVDLPPNEAFRRFTKDMQLWWPPEYSWSGDALVAISLDPVSGGLGTEIGPFGFRCDFARVTECKSGEYISFAWQISPQRVPLPNSSDAGEVHVHFEERAPNKTTVTLRHTGFAKYGDDGAAYRDAMASKDGWPRLMKLYANV